MSYKLTPSQARVFAVLTDEPQRPDSIARAAGFHSRVSPRETAAKFCIQLVKLGLAEKAGTQRFPMWRRVPAR